MLGPIACKVILYAQIVTLASTTFMLTSMSYDRFLAICRPLRTPGNALAPAKRLIAGSWCLAFVLAIPQIFIFVQVEEVDPLLGITRIACESKGYTAMWQRKLYFTWLTSYILIIPGVIISYCYINVLRTVWKAAREHPPADSTSVFLRRSQNAHATIPRAKIKTLKLTISIIASFVICWTPYFITLALLNSALNPIFYGLFNVRLRKDFREIVYRRREFGASPSPQHFEVPALAVDSSDTYIGSMGNTTPHPFSQAKNCRQ
ncbi:annetocin receptor [Caerostris extrusa]|uniref:Annetocin receptor n=1 Tax=Caerostris extrusa TaxID=172846 RepID=A0AAV4TGX7_CAEEX|nr:annetocin receptor [Caerostris extrusa]